MSDFQQVALLLMLTVSVILQFYAAFLALLLIQPSRNNLAWIMISSALLLMAVRRVIVIFHLLSGGAAHLPDLYAEIIAFVTSLLLVAGLVSIGPLIRRIGSAVPEPKDASFGELFEKITSGVAVYQPVDKGRNFIIRDINPAAERIDKIARQHVAGRRLAEVFPGIEKFGLPDVLRRVWKTGQPEHFPLHYYQDDRIAGWRDNFVYRRFSGEVVAVYNDVSAQMHLQDELERWERKFRLLFEQTPLPYQALDNEGKIVEVNPAWLRLTGLTRDSAAGRPFSELLTRTGRQNFQACQSGLKTAGAAVGTALELRRNDGVLLNIEMDAVCSRSRTGGAEQIYCILHESSGQGTEPDAKTGSGRQAGVPDGEQLAGERRKLQMQRLSMMGELAVGMAHEISGPLTVARNAFSLMREDMSPANPHYEFAEMASRALSRMANMVEQMCRFHEPVSQECEKLNINALLDNALVLVRSSMKDRRIQLRDERAQTVPFVMLPPGAVMLTLINPVKNSIAAMSMDGVLTLRTGPADTGGVFVEIEDDGPGIPQEFLPHLFEPFTTFRQSGVESTGIGLGLAIVRRTLDVLGGSVTVRSTPGAGTCVKIVLPASLPVQGDMG